MNITEFYHEVLGANLRNSRWSWGAYDPVSNRLFLRVWEDQLISQDGREKVHVLWKNPIRDSLGYPERVAHLGLMRDGAETFGILCRSDLPTGYRRIKGFDNSLLLELGELIEESDQVYAVVTGRRPTSELHRKPSAHSTVAVDILRIQRAKSEKTIKQALINARVGQGQFRSDVLSLWNHCCSVTGSKTLDAVRASHIKPWRTCSNEERLDPYNGLPLVASLDALFDAGLISFDESGSMLVADCLSEKERDILGIEARALLCEPPEQTLEYIRFHSSNIFLADG